MGTGIEQALQQGGQHPAAGEAGEGAVDLREGRPVHVGQPTRLAFLSAHQDEDVTGIGIDLGARVLMWRFIGAILLMAAIALVLLDRN
jgi:hypothetical protein